MMLHAFTRLDLPLTDHCNLRCSFCYAADGWQRGADMGHICQAIDWFLSLPRTAEQRNVTITFYGGEPLLAWEELQDAVAYGNRCAEKVQVKWTVVTNGVLYTLKRAQWLRDNGVTVAVSIDGCAAAQDTHRVFPDGTGSHEVVYKNIRELRVAGIAPHKVRMTVTPANVQWFSESHRFLAEDLGFERINAVLAYSEDWTPAALATLSNELRLTTDWWLDAVRAGRWFSLYHLRNMFKGLWNGRRDPGYCAAGQSTIAVDTNGDLWPCHRFCNPASPQDWKLGTLTAGLTNHVLRKRISSASNTRDNLAQCASCSAVLGCNALCLHDCMLRGTWRQPFPEMCNVWRLYWAEAMRAHAILTAENDPTYRRHFESERVNQHVRDVLRKDQAERKAAKETPT